MCTATLVAIANFGFLRNFSPDFQYFSDYLTGPKNFTRAEITQEIHPVVAYSTVVMMLISLLVTDLLKYKPIIILGSVAILCSKSLLYFGTTITEMQVAEMFYAVAKSSSLGYITYIYTQIDKENYRLGTTIVQISPKLGTMVSSLVAQILLFFQLATLDNLLQINIVALFLALLLSLSFPTPKYPSHSPADEKSINSSTKTQNSDRVSEKLMTRIICLWKELKSTFRNPYLVKWVVWTVFSSGLIDMVSQYYAQALWSEVSGQKQNIYNGFADELYLVFSVTGCYIAGKVAVDWEENADMVLAVISALQGVFVLLSGSSKHLTYVYLYHAVYSAFNDVSAVLYRAEMAQHLENFGLIFGIDQFLGIIFQSILTVVLISKHGLALSIRVQFTIIGWCSIALGIVLLLKMVFHLLNKSRGSVTIQQRIERF